MPYPEYLLTPMREELTRLGVQELKTAAAVDEAMDAAQEGTSLFIVNSVCGCAAANARPAVSLATQAEVQPDRIFTVFAGQDLDATTQFRSYLPGVPPSSPSMFLFKNGEPVYLIERRFIEGRSAQSIGMDLVNAYRKYVGTEEMPDVPEIPDVPMPQFAMGGRPGSFRSIM